MRDDFETLSRSIKKRWPAIGRRLDHPMAEWFFNRNRPKKSEFNVRNIIFTTINIALVTLILIALFNGKLSSDYWWLIYVIFPLIRTPKPNLQIVTGTPTAFFQAKDKRGLYDVWLSGLNYDHMAAICAMLAIKVAQRQRLHGHLIGNAGYFILATAIHMKTPFSIVAWILAGMGLVLLNMIIFGYYQPDQQAQVAFSQLRMATMERAGGCEQLMRSFGVALFAIFFGIVVVMAYICLNLMLLSLLKNRMPEPDIYMMSGIVFMCIAVVAGVQYFRKHQKLKTVETFRELSHIGQRMFAEIVHNENELRKNI